MSAHDHLVNALVAHLEGEGFKNIKADLPGHDEPDAIYWNNKPSTRRIPDATATHSSTPFIFEVETADSIGSDHSNEQWKLFAAHASNNDGHFVIFVEEGAEAKARKHVKELGIEAEVW